MSAHSNLGLPEPENYFLGRTNANSLLADQLLFFERTNSSQLKGNAQKSNSHRRFVLCVCLRTRGSVFIDHERIDLIENSAVLIPPFHFHYYDHLESELLSWLFITFDAPHSSPLLTRKPAPSYLDLPLKNDLISLCQLYQKGNSSIDHAHLLLKTNAFLYDLFTQNLAPPVEQQSRPKNHSLAERIQNELQRTPDLSLSILAKRLGYSEGHLRHRFRESQNMSLNDYVNHYRLHWAIRKLQDPANTLIDIAAQLGFASQASFTRFFKRMTKTPPARFRRNLTS